MKALTGLLVALGLLGLALVVVFYVPAWADDMDRYPPPGPDGRIQSDRSKTTYTTNSMDFLNTDTRERFIREWTASGEVCRVLGRHSWDKIPMYDGPVWNVKRVGTLFRCSICGKTETKKEVWR